MDSPRAIGALLALVMALSPRGVAAAQEAEDPRLTEARERIARGEALFERGDHDASLAEFERAHALLEGHPLRYLALYNIGQCHEQLFRYDEAMGFYARYLAEGGDDAEDAAEVRARIELLDGLLGGLRIDSDVEGAEIWIDDRRVGRAPARIRVPGGSHVVELRAPGHLPARRPVQVRAREEQRLEIDLEVVPEPYEGLGPGLFLTSAGLAVAAGIVGAAFGARALSARSDVDERLDDPALRLSVTQDDRDEIRRLSITADAMFGAALVFATGAVILAFLTDWGSEEAPPAEAALSWRAHASREGAALTLLGRY